MDYLPILAVVLLLDSCLVDTNTLQQVHVIFRHGDRNPNSALYPTDPNKNDTWYPDGFGQLTKYGKIQEYNIGKALRNRYNDFLGPIYTPDIVDPLSTDYNRTKASLALVLAGLFPPNFDQHWNDMLPWLPIPYNYVSWQKDPVMRYALFYCQKYTDLYFKAAKTKIFQEFWKTNVDLIQYITDNSGVNITSYLDLYEMYAVLYAEVQTGREISSWSKNVFPDFLSNASDLYYTLQTFTNEMRKYSGGNMLKKIISDARAKMLGNLSPKNRKIYLYSGHEYNVGYILRALKVFKPHNPPYGSYVIVEFHKIDKVYGFKILYQDYSHSSPQYMVVPGCDVFCPFNTFLEVLDSIIPKDGEEC